MAGIFAFDEPINASYNGTHYLLIVDGIDKIVDDLRVDALSKSFPERSCPPLILLRIKSI